MPDPTELDEEELRWAAAAGNPLWNLSHMEDHDAEADQVLADTEQLRQQLSEQPPIRVAPPEDLEGDTSDPAGRLERALNVQRDEPSSTPVERREYARQQQGRGEDPPAVPRWSTEAQREALVEPPSFERPPEGESAPRQRRRERREQRAYDRSPPEQMSGADARGRLAEMGPRPEDDLGAPRPDGRPNWATTEQQDLEAQQRLGQRANTDPELPAWAAAPTQSPGAAPAAPQQAAPPSETPPDDPSERLAQALNATPGFSAEPAEGGDASPYYPDPSGPAAAYPAQDLGGGGGEQEGGGFPDLGTRLLDAFGRGLMQIGGARDIPRPVHEQWQQQQERDRRNDLMQARYGGDGGPADEARMAQARMMNLRSDVIEEDRDPTSEASRSARERLRLALQGAPEAVAEQFWQRIEGQGLAFDDLSRQDVDELGRLLGITMRPMLHRQSRRSGGVAGVPTGPDAGGARRVPQTDRGQTLVTDEMMQAYGLDPNSDLAEALRAGADDEVTQRMITRLVTETNDDIRKYGEWRRRIVRSDSAMNEVEEMLDRYRGRPIPGLSTTDQLISQYGPEVAQRLLSQDARANQRRLELLEEALLRDATGAVVNESEGERYRQLTGRLRFGTEQDIRDSISLFRDFLERQRRLAANSFPPHVIDEFERRGQRYDAEGRNRVDEMPSGQGLNERRRPRRSSPQPAQRQRQPAAQPAAAPQQSGRVTVRLRRDSRSHSAGDEVEVSAEMARRLVASGAAEEL